MAKKSAKLLSPAFYLSFVFIFLFNTLLYRYLKMVLDSTDVWSPRSSQWNLRLAEWQDKIHMTDPVRAGKIAISGRENYEKLSTEQILKVIESIESHPLLWDMTDPAYKDTEKKNDCWWTLEKSLKFLKVEKGSNLKKIYTQLVGAYRQEKKNREMPSGSGVDDLLESFQFFEELQFLDNVMKQKSPQPSADSTPSITRRLVHLEAGARKRSCPKKESSDKEEIDFNESIKMCTEALLRRREDRQFDEFSGLFAKIKNKMSTLSPSKKFDLSMEIGKVCDNFGKDLHNSFSSIFPYDLQSSSFHDYPKF